MARGVYNFTASAESKSSNWPESWNEPIDSLADGSTSLQEFDLQASDAHFGELDDSNLDEDQFSVPAQPYSASPYIPMISESSPTRSPPHPASPDPLKQVTRENGQPIKKAYFRIQLIRAFKKSIQQIATRKWAKAGICRLDKRDEAQKRMWTEYYYCYKARKNEFSREVWGLLHDNTEKSFGNQYCRRVFECAASRIMYFHFLQLVFPPNFTPESACSKLKFKCCPNLSHTDHCSDIWLGVKRFAATMMMRELGLEPWNGSGWGEVPDTESLLSISE